MTATSKRLKIALALALLLLIFSHADWSVFNQSLRQTSLPLFVAATAFSFLLLLLPSFALKRLFSDYHIPLRPLQIYVISLQSQFYSLVVLGDLAAAASRFIKFSRLHQKNALGSNHVRGAVLSIIMIENFMGFAALLLTLPIFLFFFPRPGVTVWFQRLSLFLIFASGLVYGLLPRLPYSRFLSKWPGQTGKRLGSEFSRLIAEFFSIPPRRMIVTWIFFITYQMAGLVLVDWMLAQSLQLEIPLMFFLPVAAAVRIARYVPITPSGIGIREGLYPLLLKSCGVPFETALTLGVLGTVSLMIMGLFGGLLEGKDWLKK